jgi:RNA recognition motif-containing protein
LDYSTPVEELRSIFNEYGEIEECVIPTERGSGKSK